jgi:HAMP domain-containing protein
MRPYFLTLVAAMLVVTGCSQQKTNATKVLESVETSLAEIKADAERYAPEGLKGVESQLARLQASLENKEYNDVIAGTPQLKKAVDSLRNAVESGKAQARAAVAAARTEWEALSVEVPKMVEDIQSRVDELSKQKRLPWGLNKDEFAEAKSEFETMKIQWTEASDEYKSGKQIQAVEKAKSAKGMNEEIREQLKMKKA